MKLKYTEWKRQGNQSFEVTSYFIAESREHGRRVQYDRRVCLRIEGVEHQVNEKSEEVLEKLWIL